MRQSTSLRRCGQQMDRATARRRRQCLHGGTSTTRRTTTMTPPAAPPGARTRPGRQRPNAASDDPTGVRRGDRLRGRPDRCRRPGLGRPPARSPWPTPACAPRSGIRAYARPAPVRGCPPSTATDYWSTTPSHTDGEALWEKVCELGLEASSPRNAAATTSPAGAAGSRPRTATTGDTRSNLKAPVVFCRSMSRFIYPARGSHPGIQARWRGSSSGGYRSPSTCYGYSSRDGVLQQPSPGCWDAGKPSFPTLTAWSMRLDESHTGERASYGAG